jgi:thymidylate synthase (FAD)
VDKKQGSHEDEFVEEINYSANFIVSQAVRVYTEMLEAGVCPEQARMVLPQNMYTEWYWTGSLIAFARVCKLRLKKDTQKETRDIAIQIDEIVKKICPISWESLVTGV